MNVNMNMNMNNLIWTKGHEENSSREILTKSQLHVYNVSFPAKKKSFKGAVTPKIYSNSHRRRRIVIEARRYKVHSTGENESYLESVHVQILKKKYLKAVGQKLPALREESATDNATDTHTNNNTNTNDNDNDKENVVSLTPASLYDQHPGSGSKQKPSSPSRKSISAMFRPKSPKGKKKKKDEKKDNDLFGDEDSDDSELKQIMAVGLGVGVGLGMALDPNNPNNPNSNPCPSFAQNSNSDDYEDESSFAQNTSMSSLDTHSNDTNKTTSWEPKYDFDLFDLNVLSVNQHKCQITIRDDGHLIPRTIIFSSSAEAKHFDEVIKKQTEIEKTRRRENLKKATVGLDIQDYEEFAGRELKFLIEVVGAEDIHEADRKGSDAYVKVKFDNVVVHKTKPVDDTLDPIWTLKTHAYFIFTVNAENLFNETEGMQFLLYDEDDMTRDDLLGAATLSPQTLYTSTDDQRHVLPIQAFGFGKNLKGYDEGTLAIRARRATEEDVEFMDTFVSERKKREFYANDNEVKATKAKSALHSMTEAKKKKFKDERNPNIVVEKYRVRPYPDEKRVKETTWMTKDEVHEESWKESDKWIHTGSGTLAKIYLEIMNCRGLPNIDLGILGNVTDPFVEVVYEDTQTRTDTISDCLSPVWLPWTQRAFVLHTMHPSSNIFVGVIDYDKGKHNKHDFIGKATINVTNLNPSTEYVLEYALFDSLTTTKREQQGFITVRIRVEVHDQQKMMLASLVPPFPVYVNVSKEKDWHAVRDTVHGKWPLHAYTYDNIMSLVDELLEHFDFFEHVNVGLTNLIFWRNNQRLVSFIVPNLSGNDDDTGNETFLQKYTKTVTMSVPLHSMVAFVYFVTLVEDWSLLPSYIFLLMGWGLVAMLGYTSDHPNPWIGAQTFGEMFWVLVTGEDPAPCAEIKMDEEQVKAMKEYNDYWDELYESARKKAEKRAKEREEELRQIEEEMGEDIATSTKDQAGLVMKTVKPYVKPLQEYMIMACKGLRFTRNVITWEEKYFSFWISLACFAISFVFFFIPWAFIFKWTSRIIVWAVFGPWMKFVDTYLNGEEKDMTETEKMEDEKRKKALEAKLTETRIAKEDGQKLRSFKQYLFGKFMTAVPVLQMERFVEHPLPSSHAKPIKKEDLKSVGEIVLTNETSGEYDHGQNLTGKMIPIIEQEEISAPIGQVTKDLDLVKYDDPFAQFVKLESGNSTVIKMGVMGLTAAIGTKFLLQLREMGVLLLALAIASQLTLSFFVKKKVAP